MCRHDRSTPRNCTCRTELWYSFSHFKASVASASLNICCRCWLFFPARKNATKKHPSSRNVLFSETAALARTRCVISLRRDVMFFEWVRHVFLFKTHFCFYTNDSEGEHATEQRAYITLIAVNIIMVEVCLRKMFFLIHSPSCYVAYCKTRMTLLGEERIPPPKPSSLF